MPHGDSLCSWRWFSSVLLAAGMLSSCFVIAEPLFFARRTRSVTFDDTELQPRGRVAETNWSFFFFFFLIVQHCWGPAPGITGFENRRVCVLFRLFCCLHCCYIAASLFANKLYFFHFTFIPPTTMILMNLGTTNAHRISRSTVKLKFPRLAEPSRHCAGGRIHADFTVADPGTSIISAWGMLNAGTETVRGATMSGTWLDRTSVH